MRTLKPGPRPLLAVLVIAAVAASAPTSLEAQKVCKKGKPCGNTCIARNKTCRVGTGAARQRLAAPRDAAIAPDSMLYVASIRGRTYYYVGCQGWRSLSVANLRWFATREEAVTAGLRPSSQAGCAGPADGSTREAPAARAVTAPPGVVFSATCTVARVIDGDTFQCGDERVRMLLIDAPELDQGPFGGDAQAALIALLPAGTTVGLETDVEKRDRYGRALAYVYDADGNLVNEELIKRGFAVVTVYPPNVKYVDRFRIAQEQARSSRLGLWSGSAFECLPADHRSGRCEL